MAAHSPSPDASLRRCLLSNGSMSVMVGASGAGFTHWRNMAVTRWREDPTCDPWGAFLLLRDEDSGATWSATPQPYGALAADAGTPDVIVPGVAVPDVTMHVGAGRARFNRHDHGIDATLDIAVAGDADIELRRLVLRNHDARPRTISVTSYSELVIGSEAGDNGHPAFSKMFVETEWDAEHALLLATRRRRANNAQEMWVAQGMHVESDAVRANATDAAGQDATEYETDRALFLGRGRTLRDAAAMASGARLVGTSGCVLDPIASLRRRITLAPGESATVTLWTQAGDTRDEVIALATRMHASDAAEHLFAAAARHADAERARLGIDHANAQRSAHWLGALLSVDPAQRAAPARLALGRGGPPSFWGKAISGDRPIVLLSVADADALATANQVLLAQRDWQSRQFGVDVVLLNTAQPSDAQPNTAQGADRDAIESRLGALVEEQRRQLGAQRAGGAPLAKAEVFHLRDADLDDATRDGLLTAARVVLGASVATRAA